MNIFDIPNEKPFTVKAIEIKGLEGHRLLEMGIFPGKVIKKIKMAPLGNTVLLEIDGVKVAMRMETALHISLS